MIWSKCTRVTLKSKICNLDDPRSIQRIQDTAPQEGTGDDEVSGSSHDIIVEPVLDEVFMFMCLIDALSAWLNYSRTSPDSPSTCIMQTIMTTAATAQAVELLKRKDRTSIIVEVFLSFTADLKLFYWSDLNAKSLAYMVDAESRGAEERKTLSFFFTVNWFPKISFPHIGRGRIFSNERQKER